MSVHALGSMITPRFTTTRGLTLMEVLIASSLTLGVLLVMLQVNQIRWGTEERIRIATSSGGADVDPTLAAIQLTTDLERADRVVIDPAVPGRIQIRKPELTTASCMGAGVPAPACLDDPANYRWVEYAYADVDGNGSPDALRFYDNTANPVAGQQCRNTRVLSENMTNVQFIFADAANISSAPSLPAIGEEPFAPALTDNNMVEYQLRWTGPINAVVLDPSGRLFYGKVALRGTPYSDVNADPITGDSGRGLAPVGVSDPPAACCVPGACT